MSIRSTGSTRSSCNRRSRQADSGRRGLALGCRRQHNGGHHLDWRKRAHRRPQRPAHPRRPRHADGRSAAPLLAADRRRQRAREKSGQADPADGREPRALQGSRAAPSAWSTGTARTAVPTCPTAGSRRAASAAPITAGATTRPATCIDQPYEDTTSPSRQGRLRDQGLSGARVRRPVVGLHGAAAGSRAAGLGAVQLAERLSRDRAGRRAVQLVPGPGKFHRSRALRMDARQLVEPDARQRRQCAEAPQAQIRGVRARLHLQARARGPERSG